MGNTLKKAKGACSRRQEVDSSEEILDQKPAAAKHRKVISVEEKPSEDPEFLKYLEWGSRVNKRKAARLMNGYAFHNILDFMEEADVARLQSLNKLMYEKVIPKYCIRMKDNKREMLFYGVMSHKTLGARRLVSFHQGKRQFQIFDAIQGTLSFIQPKMYWKKGIISGVAFQLQDLFQRNHQAVQQFYEEKLREISKVTILKQQGNFMIIQGYKIIKQEKNAASGNDQSYFVALVKIDDNSKISIFELVDPPAQIYMMKFISLGRFIYLVKNMESNVYRIDLLAPEQSTQQIQVKKGTSGHVVFSGVQNRYIFCHSSILRLEGRAIELYYLDTFQPVLQWQKTKVSFLTDLVEDKRLAAKIVQLSYRRISEANGIMLSTPDADSTKYFFQFFPKKPVEKLVSMQSFQHKSEDINDTIYLGGKRTHFSLNSISSRHYGALLKLCDLSPSDDNCSDEAVLQRYCKQSYRVSLYLSQAITGEWDAPPRAMDEQRKKALPPAPPVWEEEVLGCMITVFDNCPRPSEQYRVIKKFIRYTYD